MSVTVIGESGSIETHASITEILIISGGSKVLLKGATNKIVRLIDIIKITSP